MSSELGAVLWIGVCEEVHGSVHLLKNGKIKNLDEKHLVCDLWIKTVRMKDQEHRICDL